MPELPEVEIYRKYFEASALDQPIASVDILDHKIMTVKGEELQVAATGKSFTATDRIGKYLFARLDQGPWVMLHFGMTGSLDYFHDLSLQPKHTRLRFSFANGYHLAYVDPRKFGRIDLTDNLETYQLQKSLGVDMLKISEADFVQALNNRNTLTKPALMEQKRFAGIGNWIADEVLFQTRIHPETPLKHLQQQQLKALYNKTLEVMQTAIRFNTSYGDFPEGYFVNYRKKGAHCPRSGHELVKLEVGGRGTFICPSCQPKV